MSGRWLFGLLAVLLAGCAAVSSAAEIEPVDEQKEAPPPVVAPQEIYSLAPTASPYHSDLKDLGPAPELENTVWLNTEGPLRLSDLQGKVVLLDMWTFGCINCQHIIPSLKSWHRNYTSQGLVVIGNHYPEFSYEADLDHLKQAVQMLDVPYAVAQDNDGATWRAYDTQYWPTLYLIDKSGHIRYRHIGEGAYDETEAAIQDLLKETYP
jgi:thiol-disulfide isomerase/thioredoxin